MLEKVSIYLIGALGEICPLGYLGGLIECIFQIQVFQQDCFICQSFQDVENTLGNLWFCPYDSWWDLWLEGLGMRFHKENHEISKEWIQSDLIQV